MIMSTRTTPNHKRINRRSKLSWGVGVRLGGMNPVQHLGAGARSGFSQPAPDGPVPV